MTHNEARRRLIDLFDEVDREAGAVATREEASGVWSPLWLHVSDCLVRVAELEARRAREDLDRLVVECEMVVRRRIREIVARSPHPRRPPLSRAHLIMIKGGRA